MSKAMLSHLKILKTDHWYSLFNIDVKLRNPRMQLPLWEIPLQTAEDREPIDKPLAGYSFAAVIG
jgi:hypothetical protein